MPKRPAARRLVAVLAGLGLALPVLPGGRSAAQETAAPACPGAPFDDRQFPCLGDFAFRDDAGNPIPGPSASSLFVDSPDRALVVAGGETLVSGEQLPNGQFKNFAKAPFAYRLALDTPTGVPAQLERVQLDFARMEGAVAYSPESDLLFYGGLPASDPQNAPQGCKVQAGFVSTKICTHLPYRVGLASLRDPDLRRVFTFPAGFEGRYPMALAYDAPHQLLYVVTNLTIQRENVDLQATGFAGPLTTIHALDVAELLDDPTGTENAVPIHRWAYGVNACTRPVGDNPFVGLGASGDYVFFACGGNLPVRNRVSGVVRVDFNLAPGEDPRNLTQAEVDERFSTEYFPFAGDLSSGQSGGDPAGERLFVLVGAAGAKRVYVFDGRHRAWVGSRRLGTGNVVGAGVDPTTGRAYVTDAGEPDGEGAHVYVIDAAQLPVPQGTGVMVDTRQVGEIGVNPGVDPATRRIYVTCSCADLVPGGDDKGLRVFEDRTDPFEALSPIDPDVRTHDIDESEAVSVTHTGAASAYGARSLFLSEQSGTREAVFGLVSESQLSGDAQRSRAQAGAAGMAFDTQTDGEFPLPIPERDGSACRDLGSQPQTASQAGSIASCDERAGRIEAAGWSSEVGDQLPVRVGYARSEIVVERTPGGGVTSKSSAVARGVEIGLPGAGSVSIGELRSVAASSAGGRPGTARSTFTVSINQVRVVDAHDGTPDTVFACGWDTDGNGTNTDEGADESEATQADDPDGRCDPATVVAAINLVGQRYPLPFKAELARRDTDSEMTGSDGGARAINQKDPYAAADDINANFDARREIPALKLTMYEELDSNFVAKEETRQVIQLAAVRTEAQYVIGDALEEFEPLVAGTEAPAPEDASVTVELVSDDGAPLPGATFEARTDVDGNSAIGPGDTLGAGSTCSTNEAGRCSVVLDPGAYVVREAAPPEGYEAAEDIPLELTSGFHAVVTVVNVREPAVEGQQSTLVTQPIVQVVPRPAAGGGGLLNRLLGLPADIFDFIRRHPGQVLLFALLWTFLGAPLYLAMRRRDLLSTKSAS